MAIKELVDVAHEFIDHSYRTPAYRYLFDESTRKVKVEVRGYEDEDGPTYDIREWLGAIAFTQEVGASPEEITELAAAFPEAFLDRMNMLEETR